eukprot:TRINITY_DN9852_c0_g1_i4.p3 TRINITY_DN9852_c0_g1~~TRINITY_DN9852_c0_g1_i4.p3  ORF type:complete len:123 (-),score=5.58 TRINITY_DN9852_c0_g1_i4:101-469(-)
MNKHAYRRQTVAKFHQQLFQANKRGSSPTILQIIRHGYLKRQHTQNLQCRMSISNMQVQETSEGKMQQDLYRILNNRLRTATSPLELLQYITKELQNMDCINVGTAAMWLGRNVEKLPYNAI